MTISADQVEHGEAAFVADDRFAIDQHERVGNAVNAAIICGKRLE